LIRDIRILRASPDVKEARSHPLGQSIRYECAMP
jgi:hypothetical protein